MHFLALTATLLSLLTAAQAYSISVPSSSQGWTNSGPQTVTWSRVGTDQANVTIVLVNQDQSQFASPGYSQVLAALVPGEIGTVQVNPPSAGWPTGGHFRVNFVRDTSSLDSILAQSQEFNINRTTGTGTSSTARVTPGATTIVAPPSDTTTDDSSATATGTSSALALGTSGGLLSVLAVALSFVLA